MKSIKKLTGFEENFNTFSQKIKKNFDFSGRGQDAENIYFCHRRDLGHISEPLKRVFFSILMRSLLNDEAPESGRAKALELLELYFPEERELFSWPG